MTDTEMKANLYALEQRIYQLEQKMKHMADVGDMVEVEWNLYGDVYERRVVRVKDIIKAYYPTWMNLDYGQYKSQTGSEG